MTLMYVSLNWAKGRLHGDKEEQIMRRRSSEGTRSLQQRTNQQVAKQDAGH